MTHELKKILMAYRTASDEGRKAVMASVVALEGSSYRRPGVRMLIQDNGKMTGAVSGGCVEKEILRQSESVFNTGIPRMMTYDGRYRLGCEGILYILIEPFKPDAKFLESFDAAISNREPFKVKSYYRMEESTSGDFGSLFHFQGASLPIRSGFKPGPGVPAFEEDMAPCFKLLLLGAEHDAVQLCTFASLKGWEVVVVASPTEEKSLADFPGAQELIASMPEHMDVGKIDGQTAVVLMTHSYVKDLQFLLRLKETRPAYLGLLGPAGRREKLLNEFLEHCPEVSDQFFDRIHGPAGINIGAETPQEIAISILAEILAVTRQQEPMPLKNKKGTIHS